MKKLLSMLALICVAISFSGCSDDDDNIKLGGPLPYDVYVQIVSADGQNLLDSSNPNYIPLGNISSARDGVWKPVMNEQPEISSSLFAWNGSYVASSATWLDGVDVKFPILVLDGHDGAETATFIHSIKIDGREYTIKTTNLYSDSKIERHIYLDDFEVAYDDNTRLIVKIEM